MYIPICSKVTPIGPATAVLGKQLAIVHHVTLLVDRKYSITRTHSEGESCNACTKHYISQVLDGFNRY